MLTTLKRRCPYCGERIELVVDPTGDSHYVEDCQVCCRPITVMVQEGEPGDVDVVLAREDD